MSGGLRPRGPPATAAKTLDMTETPLPRAREARRAALAPLLAPALVLALAAFAAAFRAPEARADDAELAAKGKSLYATYCIICHGANMVNRGTRATDLRKFPLDRRDRFDVSVKEGRNDMPPWGDILDDEAMDALWAYVRTRGKTQ